VDLASGRQADPQHDHEVDGHDGVVDHARMHPEHAAPLGMRCAPPPTRRLPPEQPR
jgi:hypothetical protein